MAKRFIFRVGKNPRKITRVKADNYEQAATFTARMIYGNAACAYRVWGITDFSGYFQAFTILPYTKERKVLGEAFHLQMMTDEKAANAENEVYKLWNGLQYVRNRNL